jgi:glutamine synthetase
MRAASSMSTSSDVKALFTKGDGRRRDSATSRAETPSTSRRKSTARLARRQVLERREVVTVALVVPDRRLDHRPPIRGRWCSHLVHMDLVVMSVGPQGQCAIPRPRCSVVPCIRREGVEVALINEPRETGLGPPLSMPISSETTPAADDVVAFARDQNVQLVDLKFTDLPGTWQHFAVAARELGEGLLSEGVGFDGSSIRGFQAIHESDMLLVPDTATACIDPFHEYPTLSLVCEVRDPVTGGAYSRDPRNVARKAEAHLAASGIADTAFFGPEAEFYIFEHVAYGQEPHRGFYEVDSPEGFWNAGRGFGRNGDGGLPNLAYTNRSQQGYFPAAPLDTLSDLRGRMTLTLERLGVEVEVHHHEVGGPGQAEIDLRFQPLVRMADAMQLYKYVVRNVARQAGKVATFMPKPIFEENGSGMHTHMSLWKNGETIMYDPDGYGLLSDTARHYVGGLLAHAPALLAFCAPTTNSYKRLVPGYEAPVSLLYSQRNRSAAVRVPVYFATPKAKRVEFRSPDPSANPYLAFAALLMAGLDGVRRRIEPPDPVDENLYALPPGRQAQIAQLPTSLGRVLDALEADHDFLLAGDTFTADLLEAYLEHKRNEVDEVRLRPHPWEFALYLDA